MVLWVEVEVANMLHVALLQDKCTQYPWASATPTVHGH
jgi:hypothetical protein